MVILASLSYPDGSLPSVKWQKRERFRFEVMVLNRKREEAVLQNRDKVEEFKYVGFFFK